MVKRKREQVGDHAQTATKQPKVNGSSATQNSSKDDAPEADLFTIQVVVGSYERALHGFTASIPISTATITGPATTTKEDIPEDSEEVKFADTFLFHAHASAIRCLAVSPPSTESQAEKVILASGATDERINLYQLSTNPPPPKSKVSLPALSKSTISENPKNRELGSLLHHSSSISSLYFPSKSKLLSGSEDNTIAISRSRDWTVLSTIKAPIPKPVGRPSGDTAAPGEVPAGINDFAVHPSMKLMVSVSKGERCMRLWNLVTGKKAGVLNFDKDILQRVGEGKYSSGEGRKVAWDNEGEEFVVAFERGAIVYSLDSKPRAVIVPAPRTKIHKIRYVPGLKESILAISSEDGRILFYATNLLDSSSKPKEASKESYSASEIPTCTLVAQLGGTAADISGRVKDFDILPFGSSEGKYVVVAASSDGAVRVWDLAAQDLEPSPASSQNGEATPNKKAKTKENGVKTATTSPLAKQVGRLIGTYETGHRITCLVSFAMTGKPQEVTEASKPADDDDDASSSDSASDSE